jgi:hypothetical protein
MAGSASGRRIWEPSVCDLTGSMPGDRRQGALTDTSRSPATDDLAAPRRPDRGRQNPVIKGKSAYPYDTGHVWMTSPDRSDFIDGSSARWRAIQSL